MPESSRCSARVHPDRTADRAGDRRGELEPAQLLAARAVQADGERRSPARDHPSVLDHHVGERAGEPESEPRETLVGDEEVRAEADDRDRRLVLLGPGEQIDELVDGLRLREPAGGAAGPDRRVAVEPDVLLQAFGLLGHADSLSKIRPAARSTSPAPTVTTRSPGRAWAATRPAASSSRRPGHGHAWPQSQDDRHELAATPSMGSRAA
jgi:hypothetical protein